MSTRQLEVTIAIKRKLMFWPAFAIAKIAVFLGADYKKVSDFVVDKFVTIEATTK
jgi:hypothetical protein